MHPSMYTCALKKLEKKQLFFFSPVFDCSNVKVIEEEKLFFICQISVRKFDCFKTEGMCTFSFEFWSELAWISFIVQADLQPC